MEPYTEILIQPLSTSVQKGHYVISYRKKYYEVSSSIVDLIMELQKQSSKEEAIKSYGGKNKKYTYVEIELVINKFIDPILIDKKDKKNTFLYEKELLPASLIDKFSNQYCFLFKKQYMYFFFLLMLVGDLCFFITTENLLSFNKFANIYIVVGLFLFTITSSLIHELGHSSACKYFGVQHGGIGIGLYLNFPVLYTDVTEIWTLNRKQRLIVNIAGVYFQAICLILILILFFITHNEIFRYLILTMNLGFIIVLNPFFKFDGYWIISDLLGVPNLRNRSKELFFYLYKYLRRQPVSKRPYLLGINDFSKCCFLLYSILANIFMAIYFLYIIPKFLYYFFDSFPTQVYKLTIYLSSNETPPFSLLHNIGMQLMFFILIGYFLVRIIQVVVRNVQKK